ncbi:hypothetical protein [Jannaschia sp. CCS1]|uniref:hypothetical protein n=1 Tax=Jannaschia sp. (strain CCS1) TaxID=290400 RepID=UPI000053D39A|nr:hypothetical protein [Jannaschia sp. CCS1]ABD56907.1 hypothetical protein Jann_3990 [Jannaschia sp. CCS1]
MTDLKDYAPLSEKVAALEAEGDILITAEDLDALAGPPDDLADCGDLIIDTNYTRHIGSAGTGGDRPFEIMDQSPGFITYVEPETLRRVGLWLLHLLFSGRHWAGLTLTHPLSRAKWLYVQINHVLPERGFLTSTGGFSYSAYEHWPQEVRRHPFADPAMSGVERVEPEDRPCFAYGWSTPDYNGRMDQRNADQIIMDLTPRGLVAMAALFFDIGHKTHGHDEVDMEPPHVGFAATHPRSIEARFWMPGSMGFYAETLDGITLPPWPEDRPQPPFD